MIDLAQLQQHLEDPAMQIFTVVRMARKDLANGNVETAMTRLRIDRDKYSNHPLAKLVGEYFRSNHQ